MTKDEWQPGTKIFASWKGPRKRKCINVSWSGATFESAFEGLKDWRKKNSVSTSKQRSQCHPHSNTIQMTHQELKDLISIKRKEVA